MNNKFSTYAIWILCLTLFHSSGAFCQNKNSRTWMQYTSVEDAGFKSELVDTVESQYQKSGASALMVISNGHVVLSIGETSRRFMMHSIRKSFMSALMGIELDKGHLMLNRNLASMEIDDINPLSSEEKKATLQDLISARSGIYLPSAYAPESMIENLPARGSAHPGEKWYYNNWDFNVLATIYNQETGKDFFPDFKAKIADPIGMEDFRLIDAYYRYEKEKSLHPAYLFKMSARDMARFGQLYLNKGKWKDEQIVPASWVDESTSKISEDLGRFGTRGGYGYLWWVSETHQGKKMYYASGSGGHRIMVLPEDNMVIVIRANTYDNRMIGNNQLEQLIQSIIEAKVGTAIKDPMLQLYAPEIMKVEDQYEGSMDQYLGAYIHPFLGTMEIAKDQEGYILKNNIGTFRMWPVDEDQFYPEDLQVKVRMVPTDNDEKRRKIDMIFNADRSLKEVICYY